MADAFNLTAQLNLRGPSNIRTVVADIRRQIGTVNADLRFRIDPTTTRNLAQLNSTLRTFNTTLNSTQTSATNAARAISSLGRAVNGINIKNLPQQVNSAANAVNKLATASANNSKVLQTASTEMQEFGKQAYLAVRRFAAFSGVTGVIFSVTGAIQKGVEAFIEYDRQFVKLQQVTGESAAGLQNLSKTITGLATGLGVASSDITEVASTLAQAGLSARDTERALKALALSSLAPSFDDMNETVEGSIALMRQFGINAGQLEGALGSVNAVAAKFAVEASDIITAIQRTGGVFATASKGVSEGTDALNEFVAVFTSVRATTRESAETIATGLRTIFTRIQRGSTIEALKEYGVNLTDLDGKFVGAYKAVELLSQGLSKIDPRDLKFSNIVEELGGFRQIGKVIPLIQQFATAQDALKVAQRGQGSLALDAAKAQDSLSNKIVKVKEEFFALFREIGNSDGFQTLIRGALDLSSALIKIADSIKGVLPALGIFAAFKGVSALTQFASGFVGAAKTKSKADGGRIYRFQQGGVVPGSGKGDKVPALLEPGEVVINNKAANRYGRDNLERMNRYGVGGEITVKKLKGSGPRGFGKKTIENYQKVNPNIEDDDYINTSSTIIRQKMPLSVQDFAGNLPDVSSKDTLTRKQKSYDAQIGNITEVLLAKKLKLTKYAGAGTKSSNSSNAPIDLRDESNQNIYEVKFKNEKTTDSELYSKLLRYQLEQQPDTVLQQFKEQVVNKRDSIALGRITLLEAGDLRSQVDAKYRPKKPLSQDPKNVKRRDDRYYDRATENAIYSSYSSGGSVNAPLVDDILDNAKGSILPSKLALEKLIQTGYGALDFDRTLKRTTGDAAYARARTGKEKDAVLSKYFRDRSARLSDAKNSRLTQFGKALQEAIKNKQIDPNNLSIISKSSRVPGLAEHINELFGIPSANMVFTSGGSKEPALEAMRTKGPRINRVFKSFGGIIQKFMAGGTAKDLSSMIPSEILAEAKRYGIDVPFTTRDILRKRKGLSSTDSLVKQGLLEKITQARSNEASRAQSDSNIAARRKIAVVGITGDRSEQEVSTTGASDKSGMSVQGVPATLQTGALPANVAKRVQALIRNNIERLVARVGSEIAKASGSKMNTTRAGVRQISSKDIEDIAGSIFEKSLGVASGNFDPEGKSIDFLSGLSPRVASLLGVDPGVMTDVTNVASANNALGKVRAGQFDRGRLEARKRFGRSQFNIGGIVQSFAEGGEAKPELYTRGSLKYSIDDMRAAAQRKGMTFEQLKALLEERQDNEWKDYVIPYYDVEKKFGLKSYQPQDTKLFQKVMASKIEKQDRIATWKQKQGIGTGDYEGSSERQKGFLSARKERRGFASGGSVGKGLGSKIYDLQKGTGLSDREFNDLVYFAKTNSLNEQEFKNYLQTHLQNKKAKQANKTDTEALRRSLLGGAASNTSSQMLLAQQLMGAPDAKYNPKYDNARRGFVSGGTVSTGNKQTSISSQIAKKELGKMLGKSADGKNSYWQNIPGMSDGMQIIENGRIVFYGPEKIGFGILNNRKRGGVSGSPYELQESPTLGSWQETGGFASGGIVPAMVSNGEAFVPPEMAKRIGYSKLNKMNQADRNGMQGFSAGGVSIFKGSGSGTSDSIGPIGLPEGSFILREKATKALGFASGGSVRRFRAGGKGTPQKLARAVDSFDDVGTKAAAALELAVENMIEDIFKQISKANPSMSFDQARLMAEKEVDPKVSFGLMKAAETGDQSAANSVADAQKKQVLAIVKEIRAADNNVSVQEARAAAERRVADAWGGLYKRITEQDAATASNTKILGMSVGSFRGAFGGKGALGAVSGKIADVGDSILGNFSLKGMAKGALGLANPLNAVKNVSGLGRGLSGEKGFYISAGLGALAGQGENIFGKETGKRGADASVMGMSIAGSSNAMTAAGLEAGTTTLSAGLATASSLAMIPGVGPFAAGLTAAVSVVKAWTSAVEAGKKAAEDFANEQRQKGIDDAGDQLGKSLDKFQRSPGGAKEQASVVRDAYALSQKLGQDSLDDVTDAQRRKEDEALNNAGILDRINSFLPAINMLGIGGTSIQKGTLGVDEIRAIAKDRAKAAEPAADAARKVIESRIQSGSTMAEISKMPDFKALTETIARANQEFVFSTLITKDMSAEEKKRIIDAKLAAESNKLVKDASFQAQTNMVLAAKAMDEANKAGRSLAMSFDRMADTFNQALGRASYELEQFQAGSSSFSSLISGEASIGRVSSRDSNILRNPRAYSTAESNSAMDRASSMFGDDKDTVRKMLGINATDFAQSIRESVESDLRGIKPGEGDANLSLAKASGTARKNLEAKLADAPDNVRSEILKKFDAIRDDIDAKPGSAKDKVDRFINEVDNQLGGAASEAARKVQDMALAMLDFKTGALNAFIEGVNNAAKAEREAQKIRMDARDTVVRGRDSIRQTLGFGGPSIDELQTRQFSRVRELTGGPTNARAIREQIQKDMITLRGPDGQGGLQKNLNDLQNNADPTDKKQQQEITNVVNQMRELNKSIDNGKDALNELANDAGVAGAALERIKEMQQAMEGQGDFLDKLATATPEEAEKLGQAFMRLQNNLNGGTNTLRNNREAQIAFFKTLRETNNPMMAQRASMGVLAQQRGETMSLFKELMPLIVAQRQAQGVEPEAIQQELKILNSRLTGGVYAEAGLFQNPMLAPLAQSTVDYRRNGFTPGMMPFAELADTNFQNQAAAKEEQAALQQFQSAIMMKSAAEEFTKAIQNFVNNYKESRDKDKPVAGVPVAARARGGVIYASKGKMVNFQPKGTDTVPAMLTPGEFVVNAKSTAKNLPLLKSINSGSYSKGGSVKYLADGGYVTGPNFLELVDNTGKKKIRAKIIEQINDSYRILRDDGKEFNLDNSRLSPTSKLNIRNAILAENKNKEIAAAKARGEQLDKKRANVADREKQRRIQSEDAEDQARFKQVEEISKSIKIDPLTGKSITLDTGLISDQVSVIESKIQKKIGFLNERRKEKRFIGNNDPLKLPNDEYLSKYDKEYNELKKDLNRYQLQLSLTQSAEQNFDNIRNKTNRATDQEYAKLKKQADSGKLNRSADIDRYTELSIYRKIKPSDIAGGRFNTVLNRMRTEALGPEITKEIEKEGFEKFSKKLTEIRTRNSLGELEFYGEILSTPGKIIRTAATTGDLGETLKSVIPGKGSSGRDLLRSYNLIDKNDTLGNAVTGFGAEILTDPFVIMGAARAGLNVLRQAPKAVARSSAIADAAQKAAKRVSIETAKKRVTSRTKEELIDILANSPNQSSNKISVIMRENPTYDLRQATEQLGKQTSQVNNATPTTVKISPAKPSKPINPIERARARRYGESAPERTDITKDLPPKKSTGNSALWDDEDFLKKTGLYEYTKKTLIKINNFGNSKEFNGLIPDLAQFVPWIFRKTIGAIPKLLVAAGSTSGLVAGYNNYIGQNNVSPKNKSLGGLIYASEGTLVPYAPKGTDTVPAMLTPGEFVINREATRKHLPLLKSINNGTAPKQYSKGGAVYLQQGGQVDLDTFASNYRNVQTAREQADLKVNVPENVWAVYDSFAANLNAASNLLKMPGKTRVPFAKWRESSFVFANNSLEALNIVDELARKGDAEALAIQNIAPPRFFKTKKDRARATFMSGRMINNRKNQEARQNIKNIKEDKNNPGMTILKEIYFQRNIPKISDFNNSDPNDIKAVTDRAAIIIGAIDAGVKPERALRPGQLRKDYLDETMQNQQKALEIIKNLGNDIDYEGYTAREAKAWLNNQYAGSFNESEFIKAVGTEVINQKPELKKIPIPPAVTGFPIGTVIPKFNKGGVVYASQGQLVDFAPKGTDTVPAMLTPGEFVVNAKSTAQHLPLLKAINNGSAAPQKYSTGGLVYLQQGGKTPPQYSKNSSTKKRADELAQFYKDEEARRKQRFQSQKKQEEKNNAKLPSRPSTPKFNQGISDGKRIFKPNELIGIERYDEYRVRAAIVARKLRTPGETITLQDIQNLESFRELLSDDIRAGYTSSWGFTAGQQGAAMVFLDESIKRANQALNANFPSILTDIPFDGFRAESQRAQDEFNKIPNPTTQQIKEHKDTQRAISGEASLRLRSINSNKNNSDATGQIHPDAGYKAGDSGRAINWLSRNQINEVPRMWVDDTGKYSTLGYFNGMDANGKNILLRKPDGQIVSVPVNRLSSEDRAYIQSQKPKNTKPQTKASGGIVYANNGALISAKNKQQDTVPAMLTPGEYVVNKDSAQKHMPLLNAINKGYYNRGGMVEYLNNGGVVGPKYYANGGINPVEAARQMSFNRGANGVNTSGATSSINSAIQQEPEWLSKLDEKVNAIKEGLGGMYSNLNNVANQLNTVAQELPREMSITSNINKNLNVNGIAGEWNKYQGDVLKMAGEQASKTIQDDKIALAKWSEGAIPVIG